MYPNSVLFGAAFALLFVFFMVIGTLIAIKRGFFQALVRFGLILACFIATVPIVLLIAEKLPDLSEQLMRSLLGAKLEEIEALSPTTLEVLCRLPIALLIPILFISIFYLLKGLTLIVFRLLKLILPSRSSLVFRILAGVIGALTSLTCLLAVFLPLWGMVGVTHKAAQTLAASEIKENADLTNITAQVAQIDNDILGPAVDNFVANLLTENGDNFLYRKLTKLTIREEEVALSEEIDLIMNTASDALSFAGSLPANFQISDLNAEQIAALHTLTSDVDQSILLRNIFAEWVSSLAESWKNGESVMGMEAPAANTALRPVLHALYGFLSTTNAELLVDDLDTFIELLDILVRHNALDASAQSGLFDSLGDPAFVDELSVPLENNDRLRTTMANLIASMGGAWAEGTDYMGMAAPQLNAEYQSLVRTLFRFLATTDESIILSDFKTLTGLVSMLDNHSGTTNLLLDDALLNDLNAFLADHPRFRGFFASWLAELAGAWAEGNDHEGMAAPKVNELMDPVMNTLFSILATANEEVICDDLAALTEIITVLRDYDVFNTATDGTQMGQLLMKSNFVSDLTKVINRHERFKPLLDTVTGLGLSAISSQLPTKLPDSQIMTDLSGSISAALNANGNGTINTETIQTEVDKVLADNNIDVPAGVSDVISGIVKDQFGDKQTVTEKEISDYLLGLYQSAGDLDGFFK